MALSQLQISCFFVKDLAFAENPLERESEEVDIKPEDVKSLQDLYQQMRESGFEGLESKRIPVMEDRAPPEFCFDMMTGKIEKKNIKTTLNI